MKIFCLSIYNENYEEFKKLNLIPVGLGDEIFDNRWLTDKNLNNISNKNLNFGEYTFHYYLWKNNLVDINYNDWIGFCSYRRFWTKVKSDNVKSFQNLDPMIIKKTEETWNNYDVILGEPLIFKKIKNLKMIKRNFLEVIKKPSVLINRTSLKDQFNIFHGSFYLNKSLDLLSKENREGFENFLNGYSLNPYNMFICKNTKILYQFYEEIFSWLFKCENFFKEINLKGYDKVRIYGFLTERYMPYWFKKNFKTTTCPITFFQTHSENKNK